MSRDGELRLTPARIVALGRLVELGERELRDRGPLWRRSREGRAFRRGLGWLRETLDRKADELYLAEGRSAVTAESTQRLGRLGSNTTR